MSKPDALSCQADHGTRAGDNENIVLLKPKLFAIWALKGLVIHGEETSIMVDICKGNERL